MCNSVGGQSVVHCCAVTAVRLLKPELFVKHRFAALPHTGTLTFDIKLSVCNSFHRLSTTEAEQ